MNRAVDLYRGKYADRKWLRDLIDSGESGQALRDMAELVLAK